MTEDAVAITFSLRFELVADYSPKFLHLRFAINRAPREGDPTVNVLLPDHPEHPHDCSCQPCEFIRGVHHTAAWRLMQDMIDSAAFRDEFAAWAMKCFEKALREIKP